MRVTRFDNASEFADCTADFLKAREAEHNLLLGVTTALVESNEYKLPPYMACVMEGHEVVGVALRTPPHKLNLSEMADPSIVNVIAQDIYSVTDLLPGVSGPKQISHGFAEKWQALTGRRFHLHLSMRVYCLDKVKPVMGVSGELRRATTHDRNLMVQWFIGFDRDALDVYDPARVEQSVDNYLTSGLRDLYFWCVDGQPVSMAGSTGPTPNGIRINAVYTPPELRGRGYASACVAAVSQLLLDSGRKFCFLFSDLGNPTSNHVYQAIGYEPVSDVDDYHFEE